MDNQENVIQDMKKQILAYRQEIIQLSTNKKYQSKGKEIRDAGRGSSDIENMRVPRLDLSKVKRDSEDEEEEEDDEDEEHNTLKDKKGAAKGQAD